MNVTIPPWLDVKPSDFAQSAAEGLQAGLKASSIQQEGNVEAARLQTERALAEQRAQTANSEIAMEGQRLAAAQQQAAQNAELRKKQLENQFLLEQQRNNVLDAYHQATIGLRQDALKTAANQQALKYGDQQALSKAVQDSIAQGMDPSKAFASNIVKFPRLWSTGVESALTHTGSAAPKSTANWQDKADYVEALREKREAQKALASDPTADKDELQKTIAAAQATIDKISSKNTASGTSGGGAAAPGSMPKVGDEVAGYRFKGGDPSDESSWEKLGTDQVPAAQ